MRLFAGTLAVTASLVLTAAAPAPAPLGVIPYRDNGRLILLRVEIEGTPLWFTLDSGARHTVIDTATARRLGLRVVSTDRTAGTGQGTAARAHAAPLTLRVHGLPLHVEDPWIIDLSHTGTAKHQDGLLGADFLAAYVVRVDPVRKTLTAYDPATYRYTGDGTALPLIVRDNRLFVRMKLSLANGVSTEPEVRIDTGSEDAVSDNIVRQSSQRRKSVQGVGLGTSYVDYSGVIDTVGIGPYTITHSWGASNDTPAVGMEILRRFTTTFDLARGVLYLEPNARLHEPVPAPG